MKYLMVNGIEQTCAVWSVLGTPFYVMEYVRGRIFKDPTLPGLSKEERRQIYAATIRVLASIHKVDIKAAGLEDYGKSGKPGTFHCNVDLILVRSLIMFIDCTSTPNLLNKRCNRASSDAALDTLVHCSSIVGEYLKRNFARWSKQYEASKTGPIEAMDKLTAWLTEHMPDNEMITLVHGDFRQARLYRLHCLSLRILYAFVHGLV